MPTSDLTWATKAFQPCGRLRAYKKWNDYDSGNHPLAFATQKFRSTFGQVFKEFAENFCPGVVDALNDRLQIIGFISNAAEMKEESRTSPIEGVPATKKVRIEDPKGQEAWELWSRNRMDQRATEVHREAILMGDGYVIVWPDENMEAAIWPQLANEMFVQYDPNTRGVIMRAVKTWFEEVDGVWRLNIYKPDGITKYEGRQKKIDIPATEASWKQIDFVPNPYDRVPVFHFPNEAENKLGKSVLRDVTPIQDALNKSVMDMMIAMEFASFKQRYVIGLDIDTDEETGEPTDQTAKNYGVERLMAIPDPEAKVGQFDATDLNQFLRVQDKFWASAARISGTPLHYFFITEGDFPSGEAMKSAEARFIKRIGDRQEAFGNQWEDVLKFALTIDGVQEEDLRLETRWTDAQPHSDAELADTAVKKKAVGVPRSQLLREMGYSDEEIDRFLEESDAEMVARQMTMTKPEDPNAPPGGQNRSQPAGQNTRGVRR